MSRGGSDRAHSPRRKRAVALRYDPDEKQAPEVAAKGAGILAERIIALAQEHGVPIHDDPDLVEVLAQLDLGQEIPDHLYRTIAEVLAFVYRVNRSVSDR